MSDIIPPMNRAVRNAAAFHVTLAMVVALAAGAAADEPPAGNLVEGRLLLAIPAALQTGLTTGVQASYTRGSGWLAFGAGASWSTATEHTLTETVRNDDIRLRLFGVARCTAGRGTMALRLGAGGTLVYEDRSRAQGSRAGLTGSALDTSTWAMLPGADLELLVKLRILDAWSMTVGGGPSYHAVNGGIRSGWVTGLGVAWEH